MTTELSDFPTQNLLKLNMMCDLLVQKKQLEFGELEWVTDMNLFSSAAAEVPELPVSQPSDINAYRPSKLHNKSRIESPDDEDENCAVPDLG